MRAFQYKVLHNSHFLNQKVFLFLKFASTLCSFSDKEDEKCYTFFLFIFLTTVLWKKKLQSALLNILELLDLVLQSAILGLSELNHQHYLILNQLLLIFKFDVYKVRDSKKMNFKALKRNIVKVCNIKRDLLKTP